MFAFHTEDLIRTYANIIQFVKLTSIDSTCVISSPNPMFDHSLESSHRDDSNKWSNIGFDEEIVILENK